MASLLVVDDEAHIRDILSELFSEEYECRAAATAEEAITLMGTHSYDVVITDLSMPGMSGEDFIGIVRTYQPSTPVIVISGFTERSRVEELLRKGVFDYLLKPFPLQDIKEKVARAIEYRRKRSQGLRV